MVRSDDETSGVKTDRIPPVVVAGPAREQITEGHIVANRYEIRARLGKGGMGSVWRAYDRVLKEEVALKALLPDRVHDQGMLEKLFTEVKLARRITHENVCRVYDIGQDGDLRFLTMQFIEGCTLRKLMREGSLGPERALDALRQVVRGLSAVHAQGIIHRDLKPENVLVCSKTGGAFVADFGLAERHADQGGASDVAGTPAYMSPEQQLGQKLSARSDIFSLGLMAFEMLSGCLPFDNGSSVTKNRAIFRSPPRELEVPGLPDRLVKALDGVFERAVKVDPAERFATAAEFGEALEAARGGKASVRTSVKALAGRAAPTTPESNAAPAAPEPNAVVAPAVARRGAGSGETERLPTPLARGANRLKARPPRWAAFTLAAALPALAAVTALSRTRSSDPRPAVFVNPLDNLTGDHSLDGLAQGAGEAIRTSLGKMPKVRVLDAPPSEGWVPWAGRTGTTWVASGSVQRGGPAGLRLEVHLRAAGGAAIGEPIEIAGAPDDPGPLAETLRRRARDEVRLLVREYERRRRATTATKSATARARLHEYYDRIGPTPGPQDFDTGERLLGEALAADPRYVPALVERASLRMTISRSDASAPARANALADIERAVTLEPQDPSALAFRCRALQIESAFNDHTTDDSIAAAVVACKEALRVDPTAMAAQLALARLYESTCRTEIAMSALQNTLEPDLDRSQLGWLLMQLVHVALQEGKTAVADEASQKLVNFYDEEFALGRRAYSRRAGVPLIQGAHLYRAAVLMRLGQPESLELAAKELPAELRIITAGGGSHWNEAAALRGLLRIDKLQGKPPRGDWQVRLDDIERQFRVQAHETDSPLRGALFFYRWVDPEATLKLLDLLGPPASFQDAFDRALIYHTAGKDDEARHVLGSQPTTQRWEQDCHRWIESKLAD